MKLTFLQVDEAFSRVVLGESGRAVARSLGVTEAALRFRWRKGPTPRHVRQVAINVFYAHMARDRLDPDERLMVDRLVARGLAERDAL